MPTRRETPPPGIYEELITDALDASLPAPADNSSVHRTPLRPPEAADRLSIHLAQLLQSSIEALPDNTRIAEALSLTRTLITTLATNAPWLESTLLQESPVLEGSVLRAILPLAPDGTPQPIESPLTPLLDTTLLTNAPGEPALAHELRSEVDSAHQLDLIIAFVRRSGLRPFMPAFRKHLEAGRPLRLLTTTYTGSTEPRALEELAALGAQVRVSYDTTGTRLHAKAWLFHRTGGMSTAYIGSSNLTHQAQQTGLEWNVRVSGARNQPVVDKMTAVFSAYWESGDFEPFDAAEFAARTKSQRAGAGTLLSPIEIRLFPFQERLLEQIEVARERGQHKNLLVAATGTGKTVMAAVDYARLRDRLPRARLLFVAHSGDILGQSLATFRHAIREAGFGELWVGGQRPVEWSHVFASIQSINAAGLEQLAPDHFDVVIFDEIHHGAAPSYTAVLDHIRPRQLLGLTATPERADGQDILHWFGGRIAAELRLWDAIDQHRLVPFEYYGVHDGTDLQSVPWRRGTGYDVDGLTNLYTANDVWARLVLGHVEQRVDDLSAMRALGFCVSVDHARFMARVFNQLGEGKGLKAAAVWGNTPRTERTEALRRLRASEINILFSVDLFNEGVDVPNIDVLLLLRPTESPVLFLQQIGRGLRKADDKTSCLVLDFIGQHRKEFRFHTRLQALLGGSRKHVERQVRGGFPFLPAGCHMELERVARDIVLQSIKTAVPDRWAKKVEELRRLADEGQGSMAGFLEGSGLELDDIYRDRKRGWSLLKEEAGLPVEVAGPHENVLRRAPGRLLHVDDSERLEAYSALLSTPEPPDFAAPGSYDARIARMLVAQVCGQVIDKEVSLNDGVALLWQHPQVRAELLELFELLGQRIDHHHTPLAKGSDVPLQVHARYTRIEILAALDPRPIAQVGAWQTGAYWLDITKTDLAAFTLDKTSGQFSPTTRYRDYAISRDLIHWETQGVVRADSDTARRYRGHNGGETSMLLFAREQANDRAFWFLGPATFVRSEGERPMAITWKLEYPLPGDLFQSFAAAVG